MIFDRFKSQNPHFKHLKAQKPLFFLKNLDFRFQDLPLLQHVPMQFLGLELLFDVENIYISVQVWQF